jgi:hypothetical protein
VAALAQAWRLMLHEPAKSGFGVFFLSPGAGDDLHAQNLLTPALT